MVCTENHNLNFSVKRQKNAKNSQKCLLLDRYPNEEAVNMVKKFGMTKVFDVNRMHINGDPKELKETVFGLTSIDVCGF